MVIKNIVVGPLAANCFIVADSSERIAVIIDPGDWPDQIMSAVAKLDVKVTHILCTHGHFDHIGGVATVKAKTGAKFLIHRADLPFVKRAQQSALEWGMHVEQPPIPDGYVDENDEIRAGKLKFKVLHTPGHSPGGVSFCINRKVFVGDTLFAGSVGRTDFPGGSFETLCNSIRAKLYKLPDQTEVYTGHGPNTTIGVEKLHNAFVKLLAAR
jgi:glyoxylase-like metal-dependent hydrolase (beta-lactamase superfamily II)